MMEEHHDNCVDCTWQERPAYTVKRDIVTFLEWLCGRLHHPFGCVLGSWSASLDRRWKTEVWRRV